MVEISKNICELMGWHPAGYATCQRYYRAAASPVLIDDIKLVLQPAAATRGAADKHGISTRQQVNDADIVDAQHDADLTATMMQLGLLLNG